MLGFALTMTARDWPRRTHSMKKYIVIASIVEQGFYDADHYFENVIDSGGWAGCKSFAPKVEMLACAFPYDPGSLSPIVMFNC